MTSDATAGDVVVALEAMRSEAEAVKIRSRVPLTDEVIGLRMRDLFDTAKAHAGLALTEVDRLLDHPAYDARLAAICILDFKARARITAAERSDVCALYLRRHDRITTWDMVDRAAPHVVGGHLAGGPLDLLHELVASTDPLRRRTAITAPLFFVRKGSAADVAGGFSIAARLAADPDPVVHRAVGIFLKHAGGRDAEALDRFLAAHAAAMPRAALRLAREPVAPRPA